MIEREASHIVSDHNTKQYIIFQDSRFPPLRWESGILVSHILNKPDEMVIINHVKQPKLIGFL